MDRTDVTIPLNAGNSTRKTEIEAYIAKLIAGHGYYRAVQDLIAEMNALAERSLSDPSNFSKQLDFTLWVSAVRTTIQRHREQSGFEHRVNDSDREWAQEIGIILD